MIWISVEMLPWEQVLYYIMNYDMGINHLKIIF